MSKTIAILGGTGDLGTGLARRWARAGHRVIIGSRSAERAEEAAAQVEGAEGRLAGLFSFAAVPP